MTTPFPITIYHNPDCGTSRNVLAFIRQAGHEPAVVAYREAGWTRPQLLALFQAAGLKPRAALREKGTAAVALGLTDPDATDDAILEAMVADPILVNRPFVVTPLGTALCRPSEAVLPLLGDVAGSFTKEDGEVVTA